MKFRMDEISHGKPQAATIRVALLRLDVPDLSGTKVGLGPIQTLAILALFADAGLLLDCRFLYSLRPYGQRSGKGYPAAFAFGSG